MIEGQLKDRERPSSEFMTLMDYVSVNGGDSEDGEFDRELRVLSAISIIAPLSTVITFLTTTDQS